MSSLHPSGGTKVACFVVSFFGTSEELGLAGIFPDSNTELLL